MLNSDTCEFGTGCHNGKCTAYGTIKVGTWIKLEDENKIVGDYSKNEFLCESFYAAQTSDNSGNYVCAWGPEA